MDLKILLKKFFPTISIVVIILCLSLMRVSPRSDMPEVPFGDKIVHVVMYMGLMLVFYFDVYRQNLPMYCTTYRSGDWWDWVADVFGVVLGLWFGKYVMLLAVKFLPPRFFRR